MTIAQKADALLKWISDHTYSDPDKAHQLWIESCDCATDDKLACLYDLYLTQDGR